MSRISGEKGFNRMLKLAEIIPVDYEWHVWGSINSHYAQQIVRSFAKFPKVKFHGLTTEPYKEIEKADYLVQLSCSEGFCYSVYEAMQCKTPSLITPFSSGKEQIIDGKNGYILPFEMDNIDFDKIINKIPIVKDFIELGSEEKWLEIINK
jgi:glycosyltransferase involved in cell wall biosynthesis